MSDWKSNYERNMQAATNGNSVNNPVTVISENSSPLLEGDEKVNTLYGIFSVLQLNELLSQLPKDPSKIDAYLTKAEKAQEEAKNLKKILDFIGKL